MTTGIVSHARKFKGILVFGDIHGDHNSFTKAYNFASTNDLFFMSLGDLVDRDRHPYEVVEFMHRIMIDGYAGFTIGNHDDKFRRYAEGTKVQFSRDSKQTLEDVGVEREAEFLRMYVEIIQHPFSGLFHKFDDIILVHAGSHPAMWESTPVICKAARSRCLIGESNGERRLDGYPVRLYNWIENVPMGKTVIVGHDRSPIHSVDITEPMIVSNKNGGKVIFMDTGCGKGGFLSGVVILHGTHGFTVDRFVDFK